VTDVRTHPTISSIIKTACKEFGRLDIPVNNAGTNPYYGTLMDQDEKTYDITMNVNLKSIFFLSQMAGSYVNGETIVVDGGRIHGEPSWPKK
jgi:NAD(P)-dependent dehydrogenase (short-subunit alcohol dehydrogenase family)